MRVRLVIRRSRVRSSPGPATFFRRDLSGNDISKVILYPLLGQEGQLSVSGERMCTIIKIF